jgi:hypothetical protein
VAQVLGFAMGYELPKNEGVAPLSSPCQIVFSFRRIVVVIRETAMGMLAYPDLIE